MWNRSIYFATSTSRCSVTIIALPEIIQSNDADRFDLAVRKLFGKRLTFAALTGKTAETTPF